MEWFEEKYNDIIRDQDNAPSRQCCEKCEKELFAYDQEGDVCFSCIEKEEMEKWEKENL